MAVTLTGDATATVETDITGDVTAVNILTAGSGYQVDDVITITEDGGAGVATATVTEIA